jgi:hypothetical protein
MGECLTLQQALHVGAAAVCCSLGARRQERRTAPGTCQKGYGRCPHSDAKRHLPLGAFIEQRSLDVLYSRADAAQDGTSAVSHRLSHAVHPSHG